MTRQTAWLGVLFCVLVACVPAQQVDVDEEAISEGTRDLARPLDGSFHDSLSEWHRDATVSVSLAGAACSGVLVAPNVVLTAAHCVRGVGGVGTPPIAVTFSPETLNALFPAPDGPNPIGLPAPRTVPVIACAVDPAGGGACGDGGGSTNSHDIALMVLAERVDHGELGSRTQRYHAIPASVVPADPACPISGGTRSPSCWTLQHVVHAGYGPVSGCLVPGNITGAVFPSIRQSVGQTIQDGYNGGSSWMVVASLNALPGDSGGPVFSDYGGSYNDVHPLQVIAIQSGYLAAVSFPICEPGAAGALNDRVVRVTDRGVQFGLLAPILGAVTHADAGGEQQVLGYVGALIGPTTPQLTDTVGNPLPATFGPMWTGSVDVPPATEPLDRMMWATAHACPSADGSLCGNPDALDPDGDGLVGAHDNCWGVYNPEQDVGLTVGASPPSRLPRAGEPATSCTPTLPGSSPVPLACVARGSSGTELGQTDVDNDGVTDACDNCLPSSPGAFQCGRTSTANGTQLDRDQNGIGDLCEIDRDCDGVQDVVDVITHPEFGFLRDNCPPPPSATGFAAFAFHNPDQADCHAQALVTLNAWEAGIPGHSITQAVGDHCDPQPCPLVSTTQTGNGSTGTPLRYDTITVDAYANPPVSGVATDFRFCRCDGAIFGNDSINAIRACERTFSTSPFSGGCTLINHVADPTAPPGSPPPRVGSVDPVLLTLGNTPSSGSGLEARPWRWMTLEGAQVTACSSHSTMGTCVGDTADSCAWTPAPGGGSCQVRACSARTTMATCVASSCTWTAAPSGGGACSPGPAAPVALGYLPVRSTAPFTIPPPIPPIDVRAPTHVVPDLTATWDVWNVVAAVEADTTRWGRLRTPAGPPGLPGDGSGLPESFPGTRVSGVIWANIPTSSVVGFDPDLSDHYTTGTFTPPVAFSAPPPSDQIRGIAPLITQGGWWGQIPFIGLHHPGGGICDSPPDCEVVLRTPGLTIPAAIPQSPPELGLFAINAEWVGVSEPRELLGGSNLRYVALGVDGAGITVDRILFEQNGALTTQAKAICQGACDPPQPGDSLNVLSATRGTLWRIDNGPMPVVWNYDFASATWTARTAPELGHVLAAVYSSRDDFIWVLDEVSEHHHGHSHECDRYDHDVHGSGRHDDDEPSGGATRRRLVALTPQTGFSQVVAEYEHVARTTRFALAMDPNQGLYLAASEEHARSHHVALLGASLAGVHVIGVRSGDGTVVPSMARAEQMQMAILVDARRGQDVVAYPLSSFFRGDRGSEHPERADDRRDRSLLSDLL